VSEPETEVRQIYGAVSDTPERYVREPDGTHPPLDYKPYKSTALRHPRQPLVYLPNTITEITGPQLGALVGERDNDLLAQHDGEPIGERIIVNHDNAWRPAHIHFSLLGRAFAQRLVTQMYFPGDPFFPYDPIFNSVPDERARERMISRFSIHATEPNWAAAYEFDVYLRGPGATPFEEAR
jgi:protocatechuate 3,4-dioxygenase beta subunit